VIAEALADTSVLVALETGRPMLARPPAELAVSVITIAELRLGVLAATTPTEYTLRQLTIQQACRIEPLRADRTVADAWAEMRYGMRDRKRRLGWNDAWIAATAIANGLPLLTQDRDFLDVPGLEVILV
jgi:predicted nucleic acid-binding protein